MYGSAADIKILTGVTPEDLGLQNEVDPDAALDTALTHWINGVGSVIDSHLGALAPVDPADSKYAGVVGVAERTVANIIAYARGTRETVYAPVSEYAVEIFNASDATAKVEKELAAFLNKPVRVAFMSSMTDDETDLVDYNDLDENGDPLPSSKHVVLDDSV